MKKIIDKLAYAGGVLFVLLALFTLSSKVRAVYNQYQTTGFGDVNVQNLLINDTGLYDSNASLRLSLGATNAITGNLTVSGALAPTAFTVTSSTAPRDVNSTIAVTPSAIGQLIYNSTDKELCVSTAAAIRSWVEVSTLAVVACRH